MPIWSHLLTLYLNWIRSCLIWLSHLTRSRSPPFPHRRRWLFWTLRCWQILHQLARPFLVPELLYHLVFVSLKNLSRVTRISLPINCEIDRTLTMTRSVTLHLEYWLCPILRTEVRRSHLPAGARALATLKSATPKKLRDVRSCRDWVLVQWAGSQRKSSLQFPHSQYQDLRLTIRYSGWMFSWLQLCTRSRYGCCCSPSCFSSTQILGKWIQENKWPSIFEHHIEPVWTFVHWFGHLWPSEDIFKKIFEYLSSSLEHAWTPPTILKPFWTPLSILGKVWCFGVSGGVSVVNKTEDQHDGDKSFKH